MTYLLLFILLCTLLSLSLVTFEKCMIAFFTKGIAIKDCYERNYYNWYEKIFAALFIVFFICCDFYMRNTVIVIAFRVKPGFELVTDFIGTVTEQPAKYETWQVARALHYRELIEKIDKHHFHNYQNNAISCIKSRLFSAKGKI